MTTLIPSTVLIVALYLPMTVFGNDTMVIHEWGTFTSLQDEDGATVGRINVDDETLPPFVHRLAPILLKRNEVPENLYGQPYYGKGGTSAHPDITMRLETPVVYFHPPKSSQGPITLDLKVTFRGGWLSEFYPDAEAIAPGLTTPVFRQNQYYPSVQTEGGTPNRHSGYMPSLDASTLGTLSWKNISVGGGRMGPETNSHVWTAPREVDAASVVTPKGEVEKFLFYRGVGHVLSPIRVMRDDKQNKLIIRSQVDAPLKEQMPLKISQFWLTEIRPDGSLAFRSFGPGTLTGDASATVSTVSASFEDVDFSTNNLKLLRGAMHEILMQEGLFADEAQALLNTWEVSYFKSAGLRLFFIVPPAWTDHQLPLQVSIPAQITRVMVGRVELITPQQKSLVERIAAVSDSAATKVFHEDLRMAFKSDAYKRASNGSRALSELGIPIPEDYQAFLELGRFRNAIVLHEEERHHNNKLTMFIDGNGLLGASVPSTRPAASLSQRPEPAPTPSDPGKIVRNTNMLEMSPRIPVR